jgi:hypothetical protein
MLQFFYDNELLLKKDILSLTIEYFSFRRLLSEHCLFHNFFLYFLLSLILSYFRCLHHGLPVAPAAALAALQRPSVATIGAKVAAARAAPHRSPPLGRVLVAGSALGRRQLAG